MENKILKVISIKHKSFDAIYRQTIPMPGIYLYGELAHWAGFHVVKCMNKEDFKVRNYIGIDGSALTCFDIEDGIYRCNVKGNRKNSTAFIWHQIYDGNPRPCGMIVNDNDYVEYEKAKSLYEKFRVN